MKFSVTDLRHWERCKVQGLPLPAIPAKVLVKLWKKHGFSLEVLPVLKQEFQLWEARNN